MRTEDLVKSPTGRWVGDAAKTVSMQSTRYDVRVRPIYTVFSSNAGPVPISALMPPLISDETLKSTKEVAAE
jgi:hypothetical protein